MSTEHGVATGQFDDAMNDSVADSRRASPMPAAAGQRQHRGQGTTTEPQPDYAGTSTEGSSVTADYLWSKDEQGGDVPPRSDDDDRSAVQSSSSSTGNNRTLLLQARRGPFLSLERGDGGRTSNLTLDTNALFFNDRTPTAAHFSSDRGGVGDYDEDPTPRSALSELVAPSTGRSAGSPRLPSGFASAALASPWDLPTYSQPPSPGSVAGPRKDGNVPSSSSPASAAAQARRRPRLGNEHRLSGSHSASNHHTSSGIVATSGIMKHAVSSSSSSSSSSSGSSSMFHPASISPHRSTTDAGQGARRTPQARLSGSFYDPLDEIPLWQRQSMSSSPSGVSLSRQSSRNTGRPSSRRTSKHLEVVASAQPREGDPSGTKAENRDSVGGAHSLTGGPSPRQAQTRHPGLGEVEGERAGHHAPSFQQADYRQAKEREEEEAAAFSLDPLLQALNPSSSSPSTPSSFGSSYRSFQHLQQQPRQLHPAPPRLQAPSPHASGSTALHVPSRNSHTAPLSSSPGAHEHRTSGEHRRSGSLRRLHRGGSTGKNAANYKHSMTKDHFGGGPSNSTVALSRAKPLSLTSLLQRVKDAQDGLAEKLLILDVRPLNVFIGPEAGRVKGSVNVNFPSLLLKRFRKGNTASFSLESFVTTPAGQHIYAQHCKDADFLRALPDLDVCLIDDHITDRDFMHLATTGSVGSVLTRVLDKQAAAASAAAAASPSPPKGNLWYLHGSWSDLLDTLDESSPLRSLIARGSDEQDLAQALQPTPTIQLPDASSADRATKRLPHSLSDNAISTTLSSARQKGRSLPSLILPIHSSRSSTTHATPAAAVGTSSSGSGSGPGSGPGSGSSDTTSSSSSLSNPASTSSPTSSIRKFIKGAVSRAAPSPTLFRSHSDGDAVSATEQQVQEQRERKRPINLQRIDTSVKHRPSINYRNEAGPGQANGPTQPVRQNVPARTLAAPRSFQELCMAQAATPTRASFASAAGAGTLQRPGASNGLRAYDNDDMPPPTPIHGTSTFSFSHNRSDSTESSGSSSQYLNTRSAGRYGGSSRENQSYGNGSTRHNLASEEEMEERENSGVVPFNVSVIIPGFLYLGPEPVKIGDVQELESVGIKRILNMAVECETQEKWKGRFEKIATIPMRDSLAEANVQERIREACVLLDDADLHSKPTYVHCKAGKSRSVTIVLAYLIHRNHWPLKRAYAHVSERRKGVSPNIGFVAELMRFEESELGYRSKGVLGSGSTPLGEYDSQGRYPHTAGGGLGGAVNGESYFRNTHSKNSSVSSNASSIASSASTASRTQQQQSGHEQHSHNSSDPYPQARSERNSPTVNRQHPGLPRSESSHLPTSLDGRPTIVRHLSLIASTAMNLTPDQARSKGAKDAKLAARNARVRESLPPGVGFAGIGMYYSDRSSGDVGRGDGDDTAGIKDNGSTRNGMPSNPTTPKFSLGGNGDDVDKEDVLAFLTSRSRSGTESAPPLYDYI